MQNTKSTGGAPDYVLLSMGSGRTGPDTESDDRHWNFFWRLTPIFAVPPSTHLANAAALGSGIAKFAIGSRPGTLGDHTKATCMSTNATDETMEAIVRDTDLMTAELVQAKLDAAASGFPGAVPSHIARRPRRNLSLAREWDAPRLQHGEVEEGTYLLSNLLTGTSEKGDFTGPVTSRPHPAWPASRSSQMRASPGHSPF